MCISAGVNLKDNLAWAIDKQLQVIMVANIKYKGRN